MVSQEFLACLLQIDSRISLLLTFLHDLRNPVAKLNNISKQIHLFQVNWHLKSQTIYCQ